MAGAVGALDRVAAPTTRRRQLGGGILFSIGLATAAGASGCGSATRRPPVPAATAAPARVAFLGRAPGVYQQTFEDLNQMFMERNPHVTIAYAHESGNFDEKYQTLIAAGQQPDVFFSSNAGFKYYVARGITTFLDEYPPEGPRVQGERLRALLDGGSEVQEAPRRPAL